MLWKVAKVRASSRFTVLFGACAAQRRFERPWMGLIQVIKNAFFFPNNDMGEFYENVESERGGRIKLKICSYKGIPDATPWQPTWKDSLQSGRKLAVLPCWWHYKGGGNVEKEKRHTELVHARINLQATARTWNGKTTTSREISLTWRKDEKKWKRSQRLQIILRPANSSVVFGFMPNSRKTYLELSYFLGWKPRKYI